MALPSAEDLKRKVSELTKSDGAQDLARGAIGIFFNKIELFERYTGAGSVFVDEVLAKADLEAPKLPEALAAALDALEGSPKDLEEAASAGAFLALGLKARIEAAGSPEARRQVVAAFVDRLDWLELASPLAPYHGLAAILEPPLCEELWRAVGASLIAADAATPPSDPTEAAQRHGLLLVRTGALALAPDNVKTELRAKLSEELQDDDLKALASSVTALRVVSKSGDDAPGLRQPLEVKGELEGPRWGGVARLFAAVTGVLLIRWILRLAARVLLGRRRQASAKLDTTTLTINSTTHLLGSEIRKEQTTRALHLLAGVTVEQRYRYLHLVVGSLVLVLSLAFGINFLVEGVFSSYIPLALFGVGVIGGGIVIDLLLEVLLPDRKGTCTLCIDFGNDRRVWRLRGVDRTQAESLAAEAVKLIPPPKPSKKKKS
jgi:hypothetical protein